MRGRSLEGSQGHWPQPSGHPHIHAVVERVYRLAILVETFHQKLIRILDELADLPLVDTQPRASMVGGAKSIQFWCWENLSENVERPLP
jgi:hypothetical protein